MSCYAWHWVFGFIGYLCGAGACFMAHWEPKRTSNTEAAK